VLDIEISAAVARRVHARFRRCWQNASMAVSLLGEGARYVEGWVVTDRHDPFVIEHGWCEHHGRIIDPSYAPQVAPYPAPVAYFPGMRFDSAEASAALCARQLPLAWSRETEDYDAAFAMAWRSATHRQASAPPASTRVVHCRREPCDVIIARPSPWAGPFHFGRDGTREQVIAKYRHWLIRQPGLLSAVWSLRGKALGCTCPPAPCHGDVLVELANITHNPEQQPVGLGITWGAEPSAPSTY